MFFKLKNFIQFKARIEILNASEIKLFIQNQFNGWPIFNQSVETEKLTYNSDNLTNLLLKLHLYHANPIFKLKPFSFDQNGTQGIVLVCLSIF